LRSVLREETQAFLAVFDDHTLADLPAPGARQSRRLGLEQTAQSWETQK
jgi:hypothetical protein